MSTTTRDKRARVVLILMVLSGAAMACIPLFLIPPAYLDLALRDKVFGAELTGERVMVLNDLTGQTISRNVEKAGSMFLARVGRINSGTGKFSVRLDGYKPAAVKVETAPLQNARAVVDLTPTFGRLEIVPVNAVRVNETVAATVKKANRMLSDEPRRFITIDLPPGTHTLVASATGYCAAEREFVVREGQITREQFPLSPDLQNDEIARFVLGWPSDPADLDSHLRRVGTTGNRNPEHLFFNRKQARTGAGVLFAQLDVDRLQPRGYETVTVRNSAVGDFEYYVHLYSGQGTLGGSGARVQIYTSGCRTRTFSVPPDCDQTIWAVTTLRHRDGVQFIDRNRCETGQILEFGGKVPLNAGTLLQ